MNDPTEKTETSCRAPKRFRRCRSKGDSPIFVETKIGTVPRFLLLATACCLLPGCTGPAGAKLPEADTWDVAMIQGQRIGHCHTTVSQANEGGRAVVKAAQTMQLSLKRFGQTTNMEVVYRDTETPDGRLIDFDLTAKMGETPMHTIGKVVGGRLELQVESQGQSQKQSVAWPAEAGGLLAPELSLRAAPLKPGERRTLKHLNFDGRVCTTELTAQKEEPVDLWSGNDRLLKIDMVDRIDTDAADKTQNIKGAIWANSAGETLKSWVEPMNMELYRVSRDEALAAPAGGLDLGKESLVKVDRPIRHAHDTKWVRYRIHMESGDPAAVFPAGASQEVKRIDDHTAEITVRAVRPTTNTERRYKSVSAPALAPGAPTDNDLKPNNFIQSDDPLIVAQAKEAVGSETDPWKQAVALEAYVHRVMTVCDFSQAFATAAEVAKNRTGDCKGHAVYLAALARSLKIPARVAVGLVYMPQAQTFGGHMWTEVYVNGRWIGLDATLGKGGIGGGHLEVSHSAMAGVAAYDVFYPVIPILNRLKIEVLDDE